MRSTPRGPTSSTPPTIRLALRYDPRPAPGEGEVAGFYDVLLDHVAAAEARGVDLVWISERPFVRGARLPAALPVCAALAARTQRIRIGVGPLALPLYHPLRVAEDAATLDGLSAGRVELALGLGGDGGAFAGFGVSRRGRGDRLEEGIALLRAAFTGAPVTFSGTHHVVSGVSVSPRPVQASGPPLWLGAGADTAVRRAARLGAGLLATDPAAIALYLAARREPAADPRPARVGLEQTAAGALRPAARDALARLVDAAGGAEVFDLVIGAEAEDGSGWLGPRALDALLALRHDLVSRT